MKGIKVQPLAVAVLLSVVSASAIASDRAVQPTLVVRPDRSLAIENVRAVATAKGWLVSGHVERQFGYARIPGSHLCVTVRSCDGRFISEQAVILHEFHHPRVVGAWIGQASFAQTVAAPPDSIITISAHGAQASECRPG